MRSHHHHPRRSFHDANWRGMKLQQDRKNKTTWVPYSLRVHGGGIHLPQILGAGLFAALICYLSSDVNERYSLHTPILFPVWGFIVALSISFRMTSAYSRWWEGRTEWDKISALTRNIARTIWLHIPTLKTPADHDPSAKSDLEVKKEAIELLHAFAVALKYHLRGERDWEQLGELKELLKGLPAYQQLHLHHDTANHPIQITLHISAYLEHLRQTRPVDTQVFTHLLLYMDSLTSCISSCERLLRTPIPLGYNIAISRAVWMFILVLPSQLFRTLGWLTVPVTMVTAYVLMALSEVGLEIENPWGTGPNNLDLDRYCMLLSFDLQDIMTRPAAEYGRWISEPVPIVYNPGVLIGMGRGAFGSVETTYGAVGMGVGGFV
ncbi:Bestrophin, RFP-TM, chloride channel-domain-containing protein [Morchella snyderi]|nr:Bestrophin, RFP-TM, chloride channel-domain-containing protein [Morchella snyderi]